MLWKKLARAVSRWSRARKLAWLRQEIEPGSSVLLVGVGVRKTAADHLGVCNIVERGIAEFADIHALAYDKGDPELDCPVTRGDACDLPFDDKSFDYVVSNAVIEHVGGPGRAGQMLAESRRVARKGAFHTTPDRWFPIETHTQVPLLHWLPRRWQHRAFCLVGKRRWNPRDYWLFGRLSLARLDGSFSVSRASLLTLVATWRPGRDQADVASDAASRQDRSVTPISMSATVGTVVGVDGRP